MKIKQILSAEKIWIIWFWKEWKATLDFLIKSWFEWYIFVFDQVEPFGLKESEKYNNIKFFCWNSAFDNLFNCDFYIKSPWIPRRNFPEIQKKFEMWKVISWTEIFLENQKWKVIWITWTKWKSTTSSLVFSILKEEFSERVEFLWNIWSPSINFLDNSLDKIFIIELSSYQLEDLPIKKFLDLWVLLNIYPDHLDYHWWFENYSTAKMLIKQISKKFFDFRGFEIKEERKKNKEKIINNKLESRKEIGENCLLSNLKLKWEHNYKNAIIAVQVSKSFWASDISIKKAISKFKWLPFRLEEIREKNRIWINDALSTNPDSTLAWVKSYEEKLNWIILWWLDRGYDFSELVSYLSNLKSLKAVALIWENDLRILWLIESEFSKIPKIFIWNDMNKIVQFLFENSEKNWVIMLSTASPSFSPYKNYIEKWEGFVGAVKSLK